MLSEQTHSQTRQNSFMPFTPVSHRVLQRKCACGSHTMGGGQCAECQKKMSVGSRPLQAKLAISEPGDAYEQEADRVAEQVMRMSPAGENTKQNGRMAQTIVQRRATGSATGVAEAPPSVHEVLNSPGQPLDTAVRTFFEPRFAQDFSQVRVHTDSKAVESARVVNALSYTVGQDVVFGARQYMPSSGTGRRLLAHELTHVVQQRNIEPKVVLQRQEMCEPQDETFSSNLADVVYDYENEVCRLPEPEEASASIPESDPIDGEFWIWPVGMREGAKPIFDDENTSIVVGFRYYSGGYYEIYNLEGKMVESGEPGLEAPLIDPIDILAGGITGLGKGLFRGGGRAVAQGVAGRGGGAALVGAGLMITIKTLSRRAVTALRGVYRAIRFRGTLNFTGTTIARMADPGRRVPHHILKLAIRFGTRSADPQGVVGAFRYVVPMIRNGRQYTLEVVIREADMTVLHFLYR